MKRNAVRCMLFCEACGGLSSSQNPNYLLSQGKEFRREMFEVHLGGEYVR